MEKPKQALSWGILSGVIVGFLLGICVVKQGGGVFFESGYQQAEREIRAKHLAEDQLLQAKTEGAKNEVKQLVEINSLREKLYHAEQAAQEARRMSDSVLISQASAEARELKKSPDEQGASALHSGVDESIDENDWKGQYKYAAYRYNKLLADYDRLQKKYIYLTGSDGKGAGIVTGRQLYLELRQSTEKELREIGDLYSKGVRTNRLRELEYRKKELEERKSWLWKTAEKLGVSN